MRPRLIAVEDELAEMVIGNTWTLQGGHGGSPWMTDARPGRHEQGPPASMRPRLIAVDDQALLDHIADAGPISFNEATADRRGGPASMSSRVTFLMLLQGGHGGSPWMTTMPPAGSPLGLRMLQGGHGGSPWMTGQIVGHIPMPT